MELMADFVLSALLLVTIGMSVYLSRALSRLRKDRGELSSLIDRLNRSSTQAHEGIEHLRQTAELVGRQLGKTVDQARSLRADLAAMQGRSEDRAVKEASNVRAQPPERDQGKTLAERDLLRALRMRQL